MSTRRSILEQCTVISALTLSLSSCAPAMQDARLLPPGTIAITPAISGSGVSDNGSDYLGQMFGAAVEVGVHERVNVGGAIGRFDISDTTVGINGAAFGARIGIVSHGSPIRAALLELSNDKIDLSKHVYAGGNPAPTCGIWHVRLLDEHTRRFELVFRPAAGA